MVISSIECWKLRKEWRLYIRQHCENAKESDDPYESETRGFKLFAALHFWRWERSKYPEKMKQRASNKQYPHVATEVL